MWSYNFCSGWSLKLACWKKTCNLGRWEPGDRNKFSEVMYLPGQKFLKFKCLGVCMCIFLFCMRIFLFPCMELHHTYLCLHISLCRVLNLSWENLKELWRPSMRIYSISKAGMFLFINGYVWLHQTPKHFLLINIFLLLLVILAEKQSWGL